MNNPRQHQYLSYKKIGQKADEFLNNHHPRLSLPIPIEEIAEQKLKLKIRQIMDLKRDYDVEGFLTSDLTTIFLDFNMYLKYESRARASIAHEIGHLVLHKEIFQKLEINSVEKLNSISTKITDEEYGWLEYQAYSFASQVLVPTKVLLDELKKRLGKVPKQESPEILASVIQDLPDIFKVSDAVILRRLQKLEIVKNSS